ncbi:hypothetical protein [Brachybacterium subflavum]|uniref:hypothetical protein n=1 Tax=Brachybacterium subflavum TaxID=2585206 RepID=UPI001266654E|nr:hypothetical protein [Brachybacterium subflavum]
MTAPQRPPRDAIRIRVTPSNSDALLVWVDANGFPYFMPEDPELYLSRDGRVLYGEKFLVRRTPGGPRWTGQTRPARLDYAVNREGTDLIRKPFAYPIVRPLEDYAPELAQRLGLTKETR